MRTRVAPALLVVAGTLLPGGGAARADAPAFVQIGTGAGVIRQTSANVIGIAGNDATAVAWRLSDSPAATAGVLDLGRTFPYQRGGSLASWSAVTSATVMVDTSPPHATASTDIGSAWTTSTTVHVTSAATDALTGT